MIKTIPLAKLVPSPRNVRRSSDPQADAELRADIEARGILQNLVVTPTRKPRGCFAVEAGERRRRALQSLADDGKLSPDLEVCCLVLEDAAEAGEASLAENFQRLSMNPADECLAFQQLVAQGAQVEDVARRFGLTIRFVEGRLRLADLAPPIFEALGAGDISLDVAKAYAATPDRERQAWVFEQVGRSYAASHPDSIRRMMTQATVTAGDRRARFVGEDAYVAAGGRIERDLFCERDSERWLDVALLERLAGEKMNALAAQTAAECGFAFVRPSLEGWVRHDDLDGLRRVAVEAPALSDDESARVDALETEIEALAQLLDDEETDEAEREAAETKVRQLSAEMEDILSKPPAIDEALKPKVGTFLLLDEHGRPRLDTTFYAEAEPHPASEGEGEGDAPSLAKRKAARLSQRLLDELSMQRRDILAAHVAADPALALDLAIFLMVDREVAYSGEKTGSSLIAMPPANPAFGFKTPEAAATIAREQGRQALDRSWGDGRTRAQRFDAFRALPEEMRAAWLGHAVANTLEASLNLPGERSCAFHDHLGTLLGIDVSRWWRPTGANFFDRVPKSVTLAALAEVGGEGLAARYGKAKKAELSQSCERIFSGDFIGDVETKEAALAWVPEAMRFAAPSSEAAEAAGAEDDTPPWEEAPGGDATPSFAQESGGGGEEIGMEEAA
jgi:ParB family chromosome partitioning protein